MALQTRRLGLLGIALLVLAPGVSRAAGFEFPDLGARALGRAGAFAATADDPTAIAYNPAGLALLEGAQLLIEGSLVRNEASFRRREAPYTRCTRDSATGEVTCAEGRTEDSVPLRKQPDDGEVSNQAGAFPSGFAAASWGFKLGEHRALAVGLGLYGPPALGNYAYPAPDYSDANWDPGKKEYVEDPRRTAPQRYSLIRSDIFITYPTLALSYRHDERFSAGVSLQYVYFSLGLTQAITDAIPLFFEGDPEHPGCTQQPGTCGPSTMREEDPFWDSQVSVEAKGRPAMTGVFGVLFKPHERLVLGGSLRPGYRIKADGKLSFDLSRMAREFQASVQGDQATIALRFPTEARLGARFTVFDGLDVELDGVYEGWSVVDRIVITPKDVSVTLLGASNPVKPIVLEKGYQDAYSGRLGADYRLPLGLPLGSTATVRAGALYESSAIPPEYTSIDFPAWERLGATAGFTVGNRRLALTAAVAFLRQPDREVTGSKVYGLASNSDLAPYAVGNGTYRSNYLLGAVGLHGRL